jgi:arylsulfatase A
MVRYIDKNVGRLEDTLKELRLREKTLIIFTSDNGTNSLLTSELHGRQIRGGKGHTHDYGTHVPLIVNWPGRVSAVKATVQIGELTAEVPVEPGAKEVVLQMTLPAGTTRMTAHFTTRNGNTVGAFYAHVKKR